MREWGDGDRSAVLVHGLTGSADVWWAVGPALADRGFHVVAVELPGHGERPAPAGWTRETLVDAVLDQAPTAPDLAIGHSLGGYTLLAALPRLAPRLAVLDDPVLRLTGIPHVLAGYRAQKVWTTDDIRVANPLWADESVRHKWEALQQWDPGIIDVLGDPEAFPDAEIPSADAATALFVLADPSPLVPPARAEQLRGLGHTVVTVEGAGHSVHHDRLDGFLAAVDACL